MKFRLEQLRDLKGLIRDLSNGLRHLSFGDNFQSFEQVVEITATTELQIVNKLTKIPKKYIVVSQTGNGLLTKGTTDWSEDFLYIYNNGAVTVTATIIFMES
jgi:hypothetical protein